MHQRILLTGFNPFGQRKLNSSEMVVNAIASEGSVPSLITEILPTEFSAAGKRVKQLLSLHRPAVCICVGMNESLEAMAIEQRAHNLDHARIPDNAGESPSNRQIIPNGTPVLHPNLPMDLIFAKLKQHEIPFSQSQSAGTFVCNHVFYTVAAEIQRLSLPTRFGFIHVPALNDAAPDSQLPTLVHGIRLCIEVCREHWV
jgi:pyroglutamyl-peptidase